MFSYDKPPYELLVQKPFDHPQSFKIKNILQVYLFVFFYFLVLHCVFVFLVSIIPVNWSVPFRCQTWSQPVYHTDQIHDINFFDRQRLFRTIVGTQIYYGHYLFDVVSLLLVLLMFWSCSMVVIEGETVMLGLCQMRVNMINSDWWGHLVVFPRLGRFRVAQIVCQEHHAEVFDLDRFWAVAVAVVVDVVVYRRHYPFYGSNICRGHYLFFFVFLYLDNLIVFKWLL